MVNKVILIGVIGMAVPEVRKTGKGTSVSNFKLGTEEVWKDKKTNEKRKKTVWHRVTAWGRLAEVCAEYLSKGDKIYIEGRLLYDSYEDSNGQTIYYSYVHVVEMRFILVKHKKAESVDVPEGGDNVPF